MDNPLCPWGNLYVEPYLLSWDHIACKEVGLRAYPVSRHQYLNHCSRILHQYLVVDYVENQSRKVHYAFARVVHGVEMQIRWRPRNILPSFLPYLWFEELLAVLQKVSLTTEWPLGRLTLMTGRSSTCP
jgi:hypothetical protein